MVLYVCSYDELVTVLDEPLFTREVYDDEPPF